MPKVRVPVIGTIGRAIRINSDATVGAQIGSDFLLPDGSTPSLTELAIVLQAAVPPDLIPGAGPWPGFVFETDVIDGDLLARVADTEVISAEWDFTTNPKIDAAGINTGIFAQARIPDPMLMGDGTVGAASYSFASQADTGMFLNAINKLAFGVDGVEIFQVVNVSGQEQILITAPPNATFPSYGFGDGKTGFYEVSAGRIASSHDGATMWNFLTSQFVAQTSGGPALIGGETSSATNPTIAPHKSHFDTGVGGVGYLSLISGGLEGIRVRDSGGVVTVDIKGAIVAGTVDADFDAITATSYGGITEANLLDKSADEDIAGQWSFKRTRDGVGKYAISVESAVPFQEFVATGAAADEGRWSWGALATSFVFRSNKDNDDTSTAWLIANRTAEVVDNATFGVPILAVSYDGILAADLLDRTVNEIVTGRWDFESDGSAPQLCIVDSDSNGAATRAFIEFLGKGDVLTGRMGYLSAASGIFTIDNALPNAGVELKSAGVQKLRVDVNGTTVTGTIFVDNTSGEKVVLRDTNSTGNAVLNFIAFKDMNDLRQGFIGFGSSSNSKLSINNAVGDIALVAANTNITGALTATSYGGITEANLLDKSAAENISGTWDFLSTVDIRDGNVLRIRNSADTDFVQFSHDGSDLNASGTNTDAFRFIGMSVRIDNTLYMTERAAADGDFATRGQLWVKNTNPNELWFTDGDGTDHQVAFV